MSKNLLMVLSTAKNDYMLKEVAEDLSDFQVPDLAEMLEGSYQSKDPNVLRSATLINSIFVHRSLVFLMTENSFAKLVKEDQLNPRRWCNRDPFKAMVSIAIRNGIVQKLRDGKKGKAGLYEVIHPNLLNYMKEMYEIDNTKEQVEICSFYDFYDKRKEEAIEYWEGDSKKKEPKTKEEKILEFERWEREQDEKKHQNS